MSCKSFGFAYFDNGIQPLRTHNCELDFGGNSTKCGHGYSKLTTCNLISSYILYIYTHRWGYLRLAMSYMYIQLHTCVIYIALPNRIACCIVPCSEVGLHTQLYLYYWLVVWNISVFPYIGNNHPNWLFFKVGVPPTRLVYPFLSPSVKHYLIRLLCYMISIIIPWL
jgi:hypothetical protein